MEKMLRTIKRHALTRVLTRGPARALSHRLRNIALEASWSPPPHPPDALSSFHDQDHKATTQFFICYDCNEQFASPAALVLHRRKAHGVRLKGYLYGNSQGTCYACGFAFWSRPRLLQHLNTDKPACLASLIQFSIPFSSDELADVLLHHKKLNKQLRGKGNRFVARQAVPVPVIVYPPAQDPEILAECFRCKPTPTVVEEEQPAHRSIPRCLQHRTLYFLSLCSDLRRSGDPQFFMDKESRSHCIPVITLSLDIANSEKFGDILHPNVWKRLVDLARAGLIIGMLMGPPCETWSLARFRELLECAFAPRPVRHATNLWGCDDIRFKELQQVLVGNDLLRIAIFLFAIVMAFGGTGIIEHPAFLHMAPEGAPSIWKLAETIWLRANGAKLVTVDQCRFGARSRKPTSLLTCNAQPLWAKPCAIYRCNCRSGHNYTLEGFDDQGNFKTAAAKTYPPDFCSFLVDVIISAFLATRNTCPAKVYIDPWSDVDDWAALAHVPLDESHTDSWSAGYAPDFHRASYRADAL